MGSNLPTLPVASALTQQMLLSRQQQQQQLLQQQQQQQAFLGNIGNTTSKLQCLFATGASAAGALAGFNTVAGLSGLTPNGVIPGMQGLSGPANGNCQRYSSNEIACHLLSSLKIFSQTRRWRVVANNSDAAQLRSSFGD